MYDEEEERVPLTPFSIDRGDAEGGGATTAEHDTAATTVNDGDDGDVHDGDDSRLASPLASRVIGVVEGSTTAPRLEIRPARLAAALGISVDDANAELCGLLAAVGGGPDGATFRFEKVGGASTEKGESSSHNNSVVMVFTFPKDFKRRALRKRRRESLRMACERTVWVLVRALKIITAFGLILSLLILCVAAILGLFAVIVAMARGGGGGHDNQRSAIVRQIRYLFYTMREMLWFYALFGPRGDDDDSSTGDPFMREIAYDLSLVLSVCCGNPCNLFFWMRARQLTTRRRRAYQGWGGRSVVPTDVEGVSLVRPGSWGDNTNSSATEEERTTPGGTRQVDSQHRGLLSVAVEFLFGPTPFYPGPTEAERWQLRAAVLVAALDANCKRGVTLREISPYFDSPPSSLHDTARILEEGLVAASHFNGVPSQQPDDSDDHPTFEFPELMAESSAVATTYGAGGGVWWESDSEGESENNNWTYMLCSVDPSPRRTSSPSSSSCDLPKYLRESNYKLTKLSSKQFLQCCFLGFLNLIGVLWLGQSISKGGVLEIDRAGVLGAFLHGMLIPVLRFYAVLFFALPIARLVVILVLNCRIRRRNNRRQALSKELEAQTR